MGNKSRRIGLILLLLVIAAVGVYLLLTSGPETVRLRGYVGGEKIGLLEDEEVQDILERDHHVVLDYAKAGSLDMVTADHTGRDFLFPSSQNALEYYQQVCGSPAKSEIIFNTPLVLYTYQPVLEAFWIAAWSPNRTAATTWIWPRWWPPSSRAQSGPIWALRNCMARWR